MSVAIVDYGSGNLHSAAKAFERAARESGHDQPILVTRDPDTVRRADRVVLPGVGAFADCKHGLEALPGMIDAMEEAVRRNGRPFLGICVGMQLMATRGVEYGVHAGLDWIAGDVVRNTGDALAAFHDCCHYEGIIPALESSHALAYAAKIAPGMAKDRILLVNLSGRGDKDMHTVAEKSGLKF